MHWNTTAYDSPIEERRTGLPATIVVMTGMMISVIFSLGRAYIMQQHRRVLQSPPATQVTPAPDGPTPLEVALEEAVRAQVRALPVHNYCSRRSAEETENDDECHICAAAPSAGEVIRTLPCGHWYHAHCIDQWLIEAQQHKLRTCPLCKRNPLVDLRPSPQRQPQPLQQPQEAYAAPVESPSPGGTSSPFALHPRRALVAVAPAPPSPPPSSPGPADPNEAILRCWGVS